MTKEELITSQQLKIEQYKAVLKKNSKIISLLKGSFAGIGMPLNDNVLEFNKKQLNWCYSVLLLIEQLDSK